MLFYFLSLFPVYSEEVDLACGETTYCYLSENNLIIQPAYDKETDQPTTATELILKRIQTGSNSIPFNIYVSFNANPYQNDEVQHKFVAIGEYAFSQINTNLGSIDLPATITSIGPGAFVQCSRLSSITITKSVEVIGKDCFYNCKSLGSVTIPASLTSIGIDCFYGCYNLRELMDYSSFGDIGSYFPYVTGLYLYSNDQKYRVVQK